MIYISTLCIRAKTIKEAVETLCRNGFRHIELSGGTAFYGTIEKDLLDLKARHGLEYILHNYFPPPLEPFVLNLASLNDDIYQRTLAHLKGAIRLSKKLKAGRFGFHAGFFIDIAPGEIGTVFTYKKPFNSVKAIERFCEGFDTLKRSAGAMELYIENNVISGANIMVFKGNNPLMMSDYNDYLQLKKLIDFKLLLDTGHLKVSSNSLGLNFKEELANMMKVCDYLHFSDNDGLTDQHNTPQADSLLFRKLANYDLKNKTVVFETRCEEHDLNSLHEMAGRL